MDVSSPSSRSHSSRSIQTLVRALDEFAGDANGARLKEGPEGAVRLVGLAYQTEPVPLDWMVTARSPQEVRDLHKFRAALDRGGWVGLGAIRGASSGAGRVLLVPTAHSLALYAPARSGLAGLFEAGFSHCTMTLIVDDWAALVAHPQPKSRTAWRNIGMRTMP